MAMNVPGYESLQAVLNRAYDHAARTKGAERHANNLPFHEQPMQTIAAEHGVGFLLGQVAKKMREAQGMLNRGETAKAVHELLGAINYTAGAVIFVETNSKNTPSVGAPATEVGNQPDQASCEVESEQCDCPACTVRRIFQADEVTIIVEESDGEDEAHNSIQPDAMVQLLRTLTEGLKKA